MKISTKQYAKALYELTKGKDEKDIDSIVLKFSKELRKKGALKVVDDIIKKFSEIYNKENRIVECEVTNAREVSNDQLGKVEGFIRDRYEAKKVSLTKKIDKGIKGGIILKVGDEVIDGSVSKKLKNLTVLLKK